MDAEAAQLEAKAQRKAERKRQREAEAPAADQGATPADEEEAKRQRKAEKKAKKDRERAAAAGAAEESLPNPHMLGAKVVTYANGFAEVQFQCVIAKPFSPPGEKLTKKILQLVNEAYKVKGLLKGVKIVRKAAEKGTKGICVMAANVAPLDVISHMPAVMEDAKIAYIWVPSRYELGLACMQKRPVSAVLIKADGLPEGPAQLFDKVRKVIKEMHKQVFVSE
eukprot:TRINITY_DN3281_c0_g1_i1.p3 TRINITY_DN3281_c0_g1~~TRINITY_DN3281_c0_g1_i1.p3  ORF type:complete len:233 (+),score=124.69 TRINITY_DN3281_c0_g1_i1:31-699(+)